MRKIFTIIVSLFVIAAPLVADATQPLNFTAFEGPATISLDSVGTPYTVSLQYSTDSCATWNDYQIGQDIQLLSGETVFFKATTTNSNFSILVTHRHYIETNYYKFDMTGFVSADGDVMSLLDATMQQTNVPAGAFERLFYGCGSLVTAPALSASQLSESCYREMFKNCTSLLSAPRLPATTLAESCYYSMFDSCTTLTSAPALPATALADWCYCSMFNWCTSLTSAPELPATTLYFSCYRSMFGCCTSLSSAPALPATTLATCCYYGMFSGCSSLASAPELPATTLANWCYSSMFNWCTSLTSAPALPATTLADWCYCDMFYFCKSLTSAPELPATTLADSCYYGMFSWCIYLTSAPALPATILADGCYCEMFYCCRSLTSAPALPATTLASSCYFNMFHWCKSLTSVPELPATTLADRCYCDMFTDCTSLKVNTTGPGEPWQIPANADTLGLVGWNVYMFANTGGTFTGNPVPGVTYYIANDTTSAVEQVSDDMDITLFPNPIHIGEPAYINTTDDIQTVEIYSPDGKCIQSITPTTSPIRIDNLNAAGIYIIRLTTKNNTSATRKLIAQ